MAENGTNGSDNGIDIVVASGTYNLSANIENLSFTGSNAADGTGNALDNVLTGNSAANKLTAAGGNDTLSGGGGNDILLGDAGNDILSGDAGKDTLTGGTGSDTFAFASTADIVNDVISDFATSQQDRIDLSLIDADLTTAGDQAFTLVGSSGAHGAGTVWTSYNSTTNQTDISVNVGGTKYHVFATGSVALTSADFIL